MSFTFVQEKALVLSQQNGWVYTDTHSCIERDFQCYFEDWSSCSDKGGAVSEGAFATSGAAHAVRDFNTIVPEKYAHKVRPRVVRDVDTLVLKKPTHKVRLRRNQRGFGA